MYIYFLSNLININKYLHADHLDTAVSLEEHNVSNGMDLQDLRIKFMNLEEKISFL